MARLTEIRDFYHQTLKMAERRAKVVPGMRPILQDLKARNIKCAILSSRATAELEGGVTNLGLRDAFDDIWGRDAGDKRCEAARVHPFEYRPHELPDLTSCMQRQCPDAEGELVKWLRRFLDIDRKQSTGRLLMTLNQGIA